MTEDIMNRAGSKQTRSTIPTSEFTVQERSGYRSRIIALLLLATLAVLSVSFLVPWREDSISRRQLLVRIADPIGVEATANAADELITLGFTKSQDDGRFSQRFFSGHHGQAFHKTGFGQVLDRSSYAQHLPNGTVLECQVTLYREDGEEEICVESLFIVPHRNGADYAPYDSLEALDKACTLLIDQTQKCDRSGRKTFNCIDGIWR